MFRSLDISASGLTAQRTRMDTIAGNIAHAHTTQAEDGSAAPFQRRLAVFTAQTSTTSASGAIAVKAAVEIDEDTPGRKTHDPGHPHADAEGYVNYPNVNLVTEFVNGMEASRAYEANVTAMEMSKQMLQTTFKILA